MPRNRNKSFPSYIATVAGVFTPKNLPDHHRAEAKGRDGSGFVSGESGAGRASSGICRTIAARA